MTEGISMSLTTLCSWYGISRQAHYQQKWRQAERQKEEETVLKLVREKRQKHPRMGGRKLLHELGKSIAAMGMKMGRDRFFDLLRRAGLLVRPRRGKRRTTWPGSWRSVNLLKDITVEQTNQAWVSDITYVETEKRFAYLCLVTDAYSRCILGYDISCSLAVEGAQRALSMAVAVANGASKGVIHHSDHGIQYTCHAYRDDLVSYSMNSSMGQIGNCYENALAERVNGILKIEYGLGDRFVSFAQASHAVDEAVWLYNNERPHLSLDYNKPHDVYQDLVKVPVI